MSHRQDDSLQVGVQGALSIQPSLTAVGAVPVLDVTVLGAGSSLGGNVSSLGVSHRQDNSLQVGVQSASLVQPSHTADVAVPVGDVTILIAGGILSGNGDHVVLDLAGLAAQVAVYVASVVILVLASGGQGIGAVDDDGGILLAEVDVDKIHRKEVLGVIGDGQIVVAGLGIVLDLEGSGEEVLFLAVALGGTADVGHDALLSDAGLIIDGAKSDVLVGGGVVGGANLDLGQPHLLVLVVIGDELQSVVVVQDLDGSGDNAGVILQLYAHFDFIAGIVLFCIGGDHDGGLIGSGNVGERNHSTQHKRRQKNC